MKDCIQIPRADLFFVILKQVEGFSLWSQSTHQIIATEPFFKSSNSYLQDFHCDDVVLGSDFNLHLGKDKKGGLAKTYTKVVIAINEHTANFDLVNAWRVSNPDTLKYT